MKVLIISDLVIWPPPFEIKKKSDYHMKQLLAINNPLI